MERLTHRHCMVVFNYYPLGEPRVQRQAEALLQAGAEVDVICLRGKGEPATSFEAGVRIYRLPLRRDKSRGPVGQLGEYLIFFALALLRVTRLHLRRRYQVVQVHNLPDFLVFVALLPRLSGAAVILDLHDLMPEFFLSRFGGQRGLAARLIRLQEQLSCHFANHVITVTRPWRETLIRRGVAPDKCSVIMNVADDRIFRPLPPRQGSAAKVHFIYHGNLTRRYGLDLALQALALTRREMPGASLTLHGWGEFLPELQVMAHELGLQEAVTFGTRLLPMEALPDLLASADVGLIPYRRDPFTDGILPTKLMEYAAVGLPVIAVRTPVIADYFSADMLETFEADDVQDLARCMLRLSQDRQRRAELARNVLRFNARYNWAAQRAEYLALVARVGRLSPPGPGIRLPVA